MSVLENRWLFSYTYLAQPRAYPLPGKAVAPVDQGLLGWTPHCHISPFLSPIDFPAGLIFGFLQFQCRRADILLVSTFLTTVDGTNPPSACTIPYLLVSSRRPFRGVSSDF